jgi:flagellar hook-associated protein 3 FlgL
MVQRVTTSTAARTLMADVGAAHRRLVGAQQRVSSGKQLTKPSDSPTGVMSSLNRRAELRRYDQYARSATDATAWLNTADSTLSTVVDRVHRARDLLLGAVSAGADQQSRNASATELESLGDELVGLANTTYLGRPIFGGVVDTPTAYASDGTYEGDGGAVVRSVGPGTDVTVNLGGEAVFGVQDADPAQGNLFQVVRQAAADLRAGNVAGAGAAIGRLDSALSRVGSAQATIGARTNQIESVTGRNSDVAIQLRSGLSEVEDVDYAQALIDFQTQQMAYQASLSVTAKIIQPTLLDFLR